MMHFNVSLIDNIDIVQSPKTRLSKIRPPISWKNRLTIIHAILVVGLIATVFVSGGYGKHKEEPMMQNEQLAGTPNTLDLVEAGWVCD